MLFNSGVFVVFLAVVLAVHWGLTGRRSRNLFLLFASYVFYGWWDWRFLALLIGSSTIDYAAGLAIASSSDVRQRKMYLLISCGVNVGALVFFKYFGFFAENLRLAFHAVGIELSWPVVRLLVPVGVSFYTLQAMTYTIDVYRRRIAACRDYPDFLLFVAYFPQLIAGPISKASQLLPQLQAPRRFDRALASEAIPYIAVGYVLKTVVADNLAGVVSTALANIPAHSGLELVIVGYCALFEMYGDFAGYTYIALGVSMLFGIRLPQNFYFPLTSQSIRDFWSRWHISLTTWFREYVFFTIVGRRPTRARFRFSIVVTFIVSGLWHGATWTSVLWGSMHAFGYFLPPLFSGRRVTGRILNTMFVLTLALPVWRLPTLSDVLLIAQRVATHFWPAASRGEPSLGDIYHVYAWRLALVACAVAFEVGQRHAEDLPRIYRWPAPARYAFYAALAVAYFYRGEFGRIPFIYFQF